MYPDEEEPMECCRTCGGAGCDFCLGTGEVPHGTFLDFDDLSPEDLAGVAKAVDRWWLG